MVDNTGQEIGNYRLLTRLASGGFGSVYLAQHTLLPERRVAIKLLHTSLTSQEERDQFLQEARYLEELKHTYILAGLAIFLVLVAWRAFSQVTLFIDLSLKFWISCIPALLLLPFLLLAENAIARSYEQMIERRRKKIYTDAT